MTDYTKTTDFTAKDSLPTGNPAKIVKGSDFDLEFGAVATAVATKANSADVTASLALKANTADIGVTIQGYDADTAKLDVAQTWTATQVGNTQTASVTGSTTLDFSLYQNFILTMTGAVTLDNPTTETVGQSGFIVLIQDATGGRTISLGSEYKTASAEGLLLSQPANAVDVVPYVVNASGSILLGKPQRSFA